MALRERRQGEWIILSQTFIWGFFPVITILTYAKLPSLISLAWSVFFAALFFGVVMIYRKTWRELANAQLWKYALAVAFFIGLLYYGFIFIGLTKTTAGNESIVALFEIFTSFIFFHLIRKDHISKEHTFGAMFMIVGAIIVLSPNFSNFNIGDIFVIIATFFAPAGNFYQQKSRKIASSETIMFARSVLTFPIILALGAVLGVYTSFTDLRSSLGFLLINGIIIFGVSKIMWIEGIHRISVTKALSLSSVAPLFTLIFAWIFLHQTPNVWQLSSLVPMLFGIFLLTDQLKLKKSIS